MKLFLIVCENLYSSKLHFTAKLAEALKRQNVEVRVMQWPSGPVPQYILDAIQNYKPDFSLSFNQPGPLSDQSYFFENIKTPHLTMLLDPSIYDINLATSPYALISCVDANDVQFVQSTGFEKCFFLPHGVEKDLIGTEKKEKPFDVVFMGTCYDPDGLFEWWRSHYPKEICDVIEAAIEIGLSDNKTSFYQAVMQSLLEHKLSPKEVDLLMIVYFVDFYMRGIERVELIRSIKDAPVHIFGAPSWREEKPIKTWEGYFSNQKNVTLHPAIHYVSSLEILKQTKICLNSCPMFKNGSHERIFNSLACGALPFTTDSIYVREQFDVQKELRVFQFEELNLVNDQINHFLNHEKDRLLVVERGQQNVAKNHTWDERAELIVDYLLTHKDSWETPH
jgi:spore maturation protein CgeB